MQRVVCVYMKVETEGKKPFGIAMCKGCDDVKIYVEEEGCACRLNS